MPVYLEPWGPRDLPLLTRLVGDPAMMEHLGGPENPNTILARQARYVRREGTSRMFKIVDQESGKGAGSVGYWRRHWRGEDVYETGWSVLPEFQRRGIASAATRQLLEQLRAERLAVTIHAFPGVGNQASNAICRKVGFTFLGECQIEYPPGHVMRCNDWCVDLT